MRGNFDTYKILKKKYKKITFFHELSFPNFQNLFNYVTYICIFHFFDFWKIFGERVSWGVILGLWKKLKKLKKN